MSGKLFSLMLELLITSFSFGVGGGLYKNSFSKLQYDLFKYNNSIEGRYINSTTSNPIKPQAEFFRWIRETLQRLYDYDFVLKIAILE
jgi:hypothetical protein